MTEERNDNQNRGLIRLRALLAALFLILAAWGIYSLAMGVSGGYSIQWKQTQQASTAGAETFRGYIGFQKGIIRYSKDGAEFIGRDQEAVWERSYQMSMPIAATSGSYAVVADQGGNSIYIFDKNGQTGSSTTILPISKVTVSEQGVVFAVLNDLTAEYITAFRADGSAIDLSVKSIISGDGYPFDIAVSPNGSQLITSYIGVTDGNVVNQVVFRNFGEVGQNENARRIVGGFSEEFAGHICGRVHFSTDEYSQAFYDGGIVFFSTRVLNSPEVVKHEQFTEQIMSIALGDGLEAVVLDQAEIDREHPCRLIIYDAKGERKGETVLNGGYTGLTFAGDDVVTYTRNHITVYRASGRLKAEFDFEEGQIVEIAGSTQSGNLYVVSGNSIYRIKY